MVSENDGPIEAIEREAQAYWNFMSQEEREQYAWLAGIIDGEGCIGIYHHGGRYELRLKVQMTSEIAIDTIQKITGWSKKTLAKRKPPRKDTYIWQAFDQRAASVLRRCLPFLRVKREHALHGIGFAAFQNLAGHSRRRIGRGSVSHSPGVEEKMKEYALLAAKLNK